MLTTTHLLPHFLSLSVSFFPSPSLSPLPSLPASLFSSSSPSLISCLSLSPPPSLSVSSCSSLFTSLTICLYLSPFLSLSIHPFQSVCLSVSLSFLSLSFSLAPPPFFLISYTVSLHFSVYWLFSLSPCLSISLHHH